MKHPRKTIGNWLFLILIAMIAVMAVFDAMNMQSWHSVEDPEKYEKYEDKAMFAQIGLWMLGILGLGVVYFLFTRDWSESIGVVVSGTILLATGLLDVFYFLLTKFSMPEQMCWFDGSLIGWVSQTFTANECVTPTVLITLSIIGIGLAFAVYQIFMYMKPIKNGKKKKTV